MWPVTSFKPTEYSKGDRMDVIIGYAAHGVIAVLLRFFFAFEEANGHVGNSKYQRPVRSL